MQKPYSLLPLQTERSTGENNVSELTCLASDLTEVRSQGLQCQTGAIYKVFKYFSVRHKSIAIIFVNQKGLVNKNLCVPSPPSLAQEKYIHFLILRNHSLTPSPLHSDSIHNTLILLSLRLRQQNGGYMCITAWGYVSVCPGLIEPFFPLNLPFVRIWI